MSPERNRITKKIGCLLLLKELTAEGFIKLAGCIVYVCIDGGNAVICSRWAAYLKRHEGCPCRRRHAGAWLVVQDTTKLTASA